MKVRKDFVRTQVRQFENWEDIERELSQTEFARECVISADDWTESVIFQLIKHDGMKAFPQVYTYRRLMQLLPEELVEALRSSLS